MLKEIDWRYVIVDEAQQIKNPLSATARAAKRLEVRPASRAQRDAHREPPQRDLVDLRLRRARVCSVRSTSSKSATRARSTRATRAPPSACARRSTPSSFAARRPRSRATSRRRSRPTSSASSRASRRPSTRRCSRRCARRSWARSSARDSRGARSRSSPGSRACVRRRAIRASSGLPREFGDEDSGKLVALRDLVETSIEGGHRVLVFSQFVSMLQIVKRAMDEDGVKYEYLDGSTKDRQGARRELPARRRAAGLPHLAQGRRQRLEPDGGGYGHPLRPVVEPRGRRPGDRSRAPHRPDARSSRRTASSPRARSRRRSSSSPRRSASSSAPSSPKTSAARRS